MKRVFIIAAGLIAALPMAHATSIVYLFTSGTVTAYGTPENVTVGGYQITIWGYDGSVTNPGVIGGAATGTGSQSSLSYDSNGLGVANTGPDEITNNSFVVVDFSDSGSPGGPKAAGYTAATIVLDNVSPQTEWIFYGGNAAPVAGGISSLTELAFGTGNVNEAISLASYSYLVIAATADCYENVKSITLNIPTNTTTPEPGTFVMAGMALMGLGMGLRKTRKR